MRPITEDDLQALVDNALDSERHREVLDYLSENPDAAARVSAYGQHASALRAALDPVAREPVPSRLNLTNMVAARQPAAQRLPFKMAAAAVVLLAMGAVGGAIGGWIIRGYGLPASEGVAALAQEASASYSAFASDRLRPVEVRADGSEALQQFASATLGPSAAIPDLSKAGYRLMGGRVVPTIHGPAFMLMYDDDRGSRLVMLSRRMAVDQDRPMVGSDRGALSGWSWGKNGIGYSVVGPMAAEELHPIADAVRSQV